jgi:hypothetical protein
MRRLIDARTGEPATPEGVARNMLRNAGLNPKEQAAVRWDPEKWAWFVAQAEGVLDALDDPDWPRL